MTTRRQFILSTSAALSALVAPSPLYARARRSFPRLVFFGAAQQVSGSCHVLETSDGVYLVDCGMFMNDMENMDQANTELPVDPREVRAVLVTHAHTDHVGRLPYLYREGFRGRVICTDATRDLMRVMLELSARLGEDAKNEALYSQEDVAKLLTRVDARPYNRHFQVDKLTVRMTDAGHILGSAFFEVWVDGRKLLFTGDMGPEGTPILPPPAQHFGADAVLCESTYGPTLNVPTAWNEFAGRINRVLQRGGSILMPTFALHKTQALIYVMHRLVEQGALPRDVPIYSDSSTARTCTRIYDAYRQYYDRDAQDAMDRWQSLFYHGRYREGRVPDILATHRRGQSAIYIATSGMLSHAAAPKHLHLMAGDERNALFIVGFQAPETVGRRILDGQRRIDLPWESTDEGQRQVEMRDTDLRLEVDRLSGLSSHARGQQILQWLEQFKQVGPTYFVHGEQASAIGLADAARTMGLESTAPRRGETFVVTGERVMPGKAPPLAPPRQLEFAPVDQ